jgi:hypothetical protein
MPLPVFANHDGNGDHWYMTMFSGSSDRREMSAGTTKHSMNFPMKTMDNSTQMIKTAPKTMPKKMPKKPMESKSIPDHLLLELHTELNSKLFHPPSPLPEDASTTPGSLPSSTWSTWSSSPIEFSKSFGGGVLSPIIPLVGEASPWSPFGNSQEKESDEEQELSNEAVAAKLREANHTTIMLRSLPNRVTAVELSDEICELGFTGRYDMCLIPKDRHSGRGRGYGFVNFLTSEDAALFCEVSAQKLFRRGNGKPIYVAEARLQGRLETLEQIVAAKSKKRKTVACLIIRLKDGCLATMPTLEDSLAVLASEA